MKKIAGEILFKMYRNHSGLTDMLSTTFKKKKRDVLMVFTDGLYFRYGGGESYVHIESIQDMYRNDNLDPNDTFFQIYFDRNGDSRLMNISSNDFKNLLENMVILQEDYWHIPKPKYPPTIKWFVATCAVLKISFDINPTMFGYPYESDHFIENDRKILSSTWDANNKEELIETLESLLSCPTLDIHKNYYENKPESQQSPTAKALKKDILKNLEKSSYAWDYQRVIYLSQLGYSAKYLSAEEALNWSLKSAKKLQSLYSSWDDYYKHYILGYSFWSDALPTTKGTEAYNRDQIYKISKAKKSPLWQIPWKTELKEEWEDFR